MFPSRLLVFAFALLLCGPSSVAAQTASSPADSTSNGRALNLTVGSVGVSIGDSKRVTGLRLNARDRRMRAVHGINATLWAPHDDAVGGSVTGLALGLPLTGARHIRGLALGVAGIEADASIAGIGIGPLGLGAGERIDGVFLSGIGLGAGERFTGVGVGGLGVGAGTTVRGVFVGGIGAGAGRHASGILVGGLGVGAGETASGVLIGGLGAGTGQTSTGLLVAGVGAGAGEDVTGLLIAGLGAGAGGSVRGIGLSAGAVGAGDDLQGLAIGGLAVGAGGAMRGVAVAGGAAASAHVRGLLAAGLGTGASNLSGVSLTGGYFRIEDGILRGVSVAGWNDVRGRQHGLAIGLYNYTRHLSGVQIGLVNVARNNPSGLRVLPLVNANL